MEPISFEVYNAFKQEMNVLADAAAMETGDGHIYDRVTIKLRRPTKANTKAVAYLTLEMDVEYFDMGAEDPFDDQYTFKYALYSDGRIGRFSPDVPYSQQQVFDAYQTWGLVIHDWIDAIKAHFDRAERKQRYAPIHEELAAKMWSPARVGALLEAGGWDLVDALA
jgi:hypothetical protein